MARQQISLAERNKTPLAILLIDLDGFKAVNDTHGHAAGDLVLKIVAERIAAHTRGADIRARLGGDEFAVLLSDSNVAGAEHVANKLVQSLAEPFPGVLPEVSASIGISHYPSCGNALMQLLEQADRALYVAKSSGKKRLVHASVNRAGA